LETRTKELTRLKRSLTELIRTFPAEVKHTDESTIKSKLSEAVNAILADLTEFITDDWIDNNEEIEEL
jgi:hypothetical protein